MAQVIDLYQQSSNLIGVELFDSGDSPVADATVELTILDHNREELAGTAWPQTLTSDGEGGYSITLPSTTDIDHGLNYFLVIDCSSPTKGDIYIELYAKGKIYGR